MFTWDRTYKAKKQRNKNTLTSHWSITFNSRINKICCPPPLISHFLFCCFVNPNLGMKKGYFGIPEVGVAEVEL